MAPTRVLHMGMGQKNMCPKWNPGKWKQGSKPAVHILVLYLLTHHNMAINFNGGTSPKDVHQRVPNSNLIHTHMSQMHGLFFVVSSWSLPKIRWHLQCLPHLSGVRRSAGAGVRQAFEDSSGTLNIHSKARRGVTRSIR